MSGLPWRQERSAPGDAPKVKIPYIDDGGALLGGSTLIRAHLETRYDFDFDKGLSEEGGPGLGRRTHA